MSVDVKVLDADAIRALENSNAFKALRHFAAQSFNVFSVFQDALLENPMTRILRFLCDSGASHGLGDRFVREWLKLVTVVDVRLPRERCLVRARFNWPTEGGRYLDLLIDVRRRAETTPFAIIGVEAKIGAKESEAQISDYQTAIEKLPSVRKRLIFLSPKGGPAETANEESECRSIGVAYSTLAQTCKVLLKRKKWESPDVTMLLTNFREYITTNSDFAIDMTTEADRLIKKLEKDPATRRAIALIRGDRDHRPTIRSFMYEAFLPAIRSKLTSDIEVAWHYRRRDNRPAEFNFEHANIRNVTPPKCPFNFYYMVYSPHAAEPHYGHELTVQLMARKINRISEPWSTALMKLRNQLPPDESEHVQWGPWICLWVGRSHRIVDLGKKDADGLTAAYVEGYNRTASKLSGWLRSRITNLKRA